MRTSIRSDLSFKTFIGRGRGETFRIGFEGPAQVLIQPSEGPGVPPHTHPEMSGGSGGGIGSLSRDND